MLDKSGMSVKWFGVNFVLSIYFALTLMPDYLHGAISV